MTFSPPLIATTLLIAAILMRQAHGTDASIAAGQAVVAIGVAPGKPGCAACHLLNGAGQPEVGIPRLAGLTSSYILDQLGYFASGARRNAVMAPYAALLSNAQKQEAADYYASLAIPTNHDQLPVAAKTVARGAALFINGDFRTGLIACTQCHGPTGAGVGDFSPRLAGQSAAYVEDELKLWHAGRVCATRTVRIHAGGGKDPQRTTDIQALIGGLCRGRSEARRTQTP